MLHDQDSSTACTDAQDHKVTVTQYEKSYSTSSMSKIAVILWLHFSLSTPVVEHIESGSSNEVATVLDALPSTSLSRDIAKDKSDRPVQPEGITFPSKMYGTVKRSFQSSWYQIFPWIEYSVERDCVFCFSCRFFGVNADGCLTYSDFCDWKHAGTSL